jgi:lipopolysaccharide export system permease protein
MPIWKRYFYKEYLSSILFILLAIYGLYITVDAMVHLDLIAANPSLKYWSAYYFASFSKRLDVLVPFAILLATIRTLTNMQSRGELVAMLVGGVSRKALLGPFCMIACCFTLLLYINYQWFLPDAVHTIEALELVKPHKAEKSSERCGPKEIMLEDGSKIVYASFSPEERTFCDLFWIASANKLFYMKSLSLKEKTPVGYWVEHILRAQSGSLEKIASFEKFEFKKMIISEEALKNSVTPTNELSLGALARQASIYFKSSAPKAAEIKTYLLHHLTFPWMCLLVCMVPAPFCLRFSRQEPLFIIYLLAIAALFAQNLIIQGALVLGKYGAVPAPLAMSFPWIVACSIFGKKYVDL